MISIFIFSLVVLLITCIIILVIIFDKEDPSKKSPYIYSFHCIYIPITITHSFFLSKFVEQKIILCLLFINLIHLITLEIYVLLFKSQNFFGFFFSPFIISVIAIILLSIFWINNRTAIIWISIIGFLNIIYLTIMSYVSKENCYDDEYNFGSALFNYCIFIFVFALAIGLIIGIFSLFCLLAKAFK